jgi:hypothetical protein
LSTDLEASQLNEQLLNPQTRQNIATGNEDYSNPSHSAFGSLNSEEPDSNLINTGLEPGLLNTTLPAIRPSVKAPPNALGLRVRADASPFDASQTAAQPPIAVGENAALYS